MWRVTARCIAFALGSSLAACLPNLPGLVSPTSLSPTPFVELSGSVQATATRASAPTPTATGLGTFTPVPTFTPQGSPAVTATASASSPTLEATLPVATATVAESISLDKLPPGTAYQRVRIRNESHSQMDISLHCTTVQGLQTVLEYDNVRSLVVQAPEGNYIYVVYVGGRKMSGGFPLSSATAVTITVYADRVVIH